MLIVATGNGKGKTTAAIGQAIRALGHGKKVFFVQFIKSDGYPSGEDSILRGLGKDLVFVKGGRGFVGILGDKLSPEEHRAAALDALAAAEAAMASGEYGLAVLDEVNVAVSLGLLTVGELKAALGAASDCDVVLTGRGAHPEIVELADFVTECVEVKHPFQQKVAAKKGIEY